MWYIFRQTLGKAPNHRLYSWLIENGLYSLCSYRFSCSWHFQNPLQQYPRRIPHFSRLWHKHNTAQLRRCWPFAYPWFLFIFRRLPFDTLHLSLFFLTFVHFILMGLQQLSPTWINDTVAPESSMYERSLPDMYFFTSKLPLSK